MPHHVATQRPSVRPSRLAQVSSERSQVLESVHAFEIESMPWYRETASSTAVPPKAVSYFFDGESDPAPAHLWLMLSS